MDVDLRARSGAGPTLVGRLLTELELLRRHLNLLREVQREGPRGILRLGDALGEPAHRIRYSLRLLEEAGVIQATTTGARPIDDLEAAVASIQVSLEKGAADLDALRCEVARLQEALQES